MATASVTNTFTAGTTAVASQVNQNFTDLVTFLNSDAVHKDGSVTMTGQLTLPSANPTADSHAARKLYVDQYVVRHATANGAALGPTPGPVTLATTSITDPGYDIDCWANAMVVCSASGASSVFDFVIESAGTGTDYAAFEQVVPTSLHSVTLAMKKTTFATGTYGGTLQLRLIVTRVSGADNITTYADANRHWLDVQYRRTV